MKKNILSLLLLFLIPALVYPANEDGIIISKITMKPIPFNERRDPLLDSPFNAFDGDVKSAALYSDFSMEFAEPVTMDKIMIMNGNSSNSELFQKNNRLRDIEVTLYTIEMKSDNNIEKKSDVKNEEASDIKKDSDKNRSVDKKEPDNKEQDKEQKEEDKSENKTSEKIVHNIYDEYFHHNFDDGISLYFVSSETYSDEDKNVDKIELDKVMEKINIQILGEKIDAKDKAGKKGKTTNKKKVTKKSGTKKTAVKKETVKKNANTKIVSDNKNKYTTAQTSNIVKLENDSEGRVLVYISLKDSMEYQGVDLKSSYSVKRIDFRARDDESYKGAEPDRTAITEISFFNKGKKIPFQDIDAMKKEYVENYNKVLRESLSNMNFVMYENNEIAMRLGIKKDGAMEFIDRYKCKSKGDADCTSEMMPVNWRITDGKLYMRYHTIWRLWKYELDCQSDIINNSDNFEPPRWMKIYFKSDNGFTDKYLDLVRSEAEYR